MQDELELSGCYNTLLSHGNLEEYDKCCHFENEHRRSNGKGENRKENNNGGENIEPFFIYFLFTRIQFYHDFHYSD